MFDAVLELRMKLQKPLAAANRLPAPEARTLFMAHNEQISSGYETLAEQLRSTLDEIQSLQKELITRNPTFCEPASLARGSKRLLDADLPDDPVEMHELVMPFLDPVIEKWQLKTQIAAGGGIGGKRFRALNQVLVGTCSEHLLMWCHAVCWRAGEASDDGEGQDCTQDTAAPLEGPDIGLCRSSQGAQRARTLPVVANVPLYGRTAPRSTA